MKASSLSMSPPWPGMRPPESFAPNRLFTADSNRSPSCDTIAVASPSQNRRSARFVQATTTRPQPAPASAPTIGARPGLSRRYSGPKSRSSDQTPRKISGDIRAPYNREEPDDRGQSIDRTRSEQREADRERPWSKRSPPPPRRADPSPRASRRPQRQPQARRWPRVSTRSSQRPPQPQARRRRARPARSASPPE